MRKHVLPALTVAGLLAISPTVAFAGGSDSPTPYEVTVEGVTLPDGEAFLAHGHINIKVDGVGYGIHFDPNSGHPGGAWIGKSSIPWIAFGIESGCVEWVQIHGFNEHYGEGGQPPVCFGDAEPEPEPDPGESIPLIPLEPATPIEPEPTPEPEPEEPEAPEEPGDETPDVPEVEEPETPEAPETSELPTADEDTTEPVVTKKTTASTTNGSPEEETAATPVVAEPVTVG